MKVARISDDAALHAVQWEPGVDHPAVKREHPPSRGSLGGSAEVRDAMGGFGIASPGNWLISETPQATNAWVVSQEQFEDEYDVPEPPSELSCPLGGVGVLCAGERCAWWHGASVRCAAFMIADVMLALCERNSEAPDALCAAKKLRDRLANRVGR